LSDSGFVSAISGIAFFLFLLALLAVPFVYAYVAYLGMAIRRHFVAKAYRNQALGVAVIAAYFALNTAIDIIFGELGANSSLSVILFVAAVSIAGIVPVLLWVDSTAQVSRKSDPYERDSLGWSRLRYVVVGYVLASVALVLVFAPVVLATGTYVPSVPVVLNVLGISPIVVLCASCVAILLVSARRAGDRTLRRHVTWFAGYFGSLLFFILLQALISVEYPQLKVSASSLVVFVLVLYTEVYCLYKSARSLAPYTRHLEDVSSSQKLP
jgi:hypothetical protein